MFVRIVQPVVEGFFSNVQPCGNVILSVGPLVSDLALKGFQSRRQKLRSDR
jgi:hypothetical protein